MKVYFTTDIGGMKYPAEMKEDMKNETCEICARLWGIHSQKEYEDCWDEVLKRGKEKQ